MRIFGGIEELGLQPVFHVARLLLPQEVANQTVPSSSLSFSVVLPEDFCSEFSFFGINRGVLSYSTHVRIRLDSLM
jgi:hypothetical protein